MHVDVYCGIGMHSWEWAWVLRLGWLERRSSFCCYWLLKPTLSFVLAPFAFMVKRKIRLVPCSWL
uniref:Uncharacterized protein n=1 Tax=Picea glauca TaxID=3330 RepID=A0A117NHB3_PICGL|nr:hypothetical protein ABT39_MTgene5094 [Picea glauca]QHR87723.1 hypothetical protein Q903MT_gene1735 [Picea sitchensis]